MKRHYFNLTELIVIVFILAMIAGMLVPEVHSARESGRRISCASNLKQIGTTMFMYAGDYNDVFPDECTSNSAATVLDSTVKGLNLLVEYNYLSDTAVYNCPSTADRAAKDGEIITSLETARTCSYLYAPGLQTGASDIYGNPDSALVADMTGFIAKRIAIPPNNSRPSLRIWGRIKRLFYTGKSDFGNHDKYGNILFQGMHVKGYSSRNQAGWFLLNYGSSYDSYTQNGSKDSSWSLTGQYPY